jgi:hypothetical protein
LERAAVARAKHPPSNDVQKVAIWLRFWGFVRRSNSEKLLLWVTEVT